MQTQLIFNKNALNVQRIFTRFLSLLLITFILTGCVHQAIQQNINTISKAETSELAENKVPSEEELFPHTQLDTWERIRNGFDLPNVQHKRIEQELNWFKRHPEYINRVVERARPYLHYIIETVEAAGIPSELALLPIVESAFQPFAYSHGRAAGIWQFIPATGKRYGLKQNWWYDGRRDVYASTKAAVRLLKNLNKNFKGDWMHALAAYNTGDGRVKRSIRRNKRKGKSTDFFSLRLPKETRAYVPKLLALK